MVVMSGRVDVALCGCVCTVRSVSGCVGVSESSCLRLRPCFRPHERIPLDPKLLSHPTLSLFRPSIPNLRLVTVSVRRRKKRWARPGLTLLCCAFFLQR